MNYYDAMVNGSSHMDLCEVANNYDSYCTNTNSPSVGVKLDPNKQIRTETYTNNGKSSTRYYYEGTLKNVNITVNGSPAAAPIMTKPSSLRAPTASAAAANTAFGPTDTTLTPTVSSAACCRLTPAPS